jgi:uncharacterized metal-binding protein
MNQNKESDNLALSSETTGFEITKIRNTEASCSLCEDFATREASKPIAVICCEGACLRGEIARQAANEICFSLAQDKAVRICLGGAFTKNTGQRNLVKNASRVIAIEGCSIMCATRMMQGVMDSLKTEVILADKSCSFDQSLFGINEMSEENIKACANAVARKVVDAL